MATVLIAGSSGLIGTALRRELRARGTTVRRLVRRTPDSPEDIRWDPAVPLSPRHLDGIDAVVNLAGAGIGDQRWTPSYKHTILASRVTSTRTLATAIAGADHPVRFVSGSAVGFYGDRGDEPLTEESRAGNGFLSQVVTRWEAATEPAVDAGASVVHVRTGIVFAPTAGAAVRLLTLGQFGLLGRMGSGVQFWPWITLVDEVAAIIHLIERPDVTGVVNVVGRAPERQVDIAKAIAATLRTPSFIPAPAFALKAVMGEFADDVLASQRVVGTTLIDSGFVHMHPDLASAVAYIAGRAA